MAEEKKNKKSLIVAIVAGVVVLAVIIAVILCNALKNKNNVLNDEFFKSTDNKIVYTDKDNDMNDKAKGAVRSHQVYNLKEDEVESFYIYIEFAKEDDAKDANDEPTLEEFIEKGIYLSHTLNGKYVVLEMPEDTYKGITRAQLERMINEKDKVIYDEVEEESPAEETETEEVEE